MSSKNKITQSIFIILPLVLAGLFLITLVFLLLEEIKIDPLFESKLIDIAPIFIGITSLLSIALMGYLYHTVTQLKNKKNKNQSSLNTATQKMHAFRRIIELLLKSKMWLPGLQEYIDEDFDGLTYFEVKDFYKGKSKLAIEFLQEQHSFSETQNLYLEMKAMLLTNPNKGKLSNNIAYPKTYEKAIIEQWIQHKVGSGLWYFFGYKFAKFKEALDINSVNEKHQDKIMSLAINIDPVYFEENSFNEIFLSKLGEYLTKTILPSLYNERTQKTNLLPFRIRVFSILLSVLIILGILVPIAMLLVGIPSIILIISYAFICSLLGYVSLSFYQFLKYEFSN